MADKITAKWVLDEVRAEFREIEKDSEEVLRKTTSDFASRAPAWVSQGVTDEFNEKKKEVKNALKKVNRHAGKVKIAGKTVDNVQLVYEGKNRALTPSEFKLKPAKTPSRQDPTYQAVIGENVKGATTPFVTVRPLAPYQVSAEIHHGNRSTYSGNVFVFNNGRGGTMAFTRTGERRRDIHVMHGPSVPTMIKDSVASKDIDKRINEGMSKRFDHHVDRILAKK